MSAETFFTNFDAAAAQLTKFKNVYDGSEIHRARVIQAFEFTFEQCWKAIQKKAGSEGLILASPKKALEWAMSVAWIPTTHEPVWLAMLSDRNLTSDTYREKTAQQVSRNILDQYAAGFEAILERMKKA